MADDSEDRRPRRRRWSLLAWALLVGLLATWAIGVPGGGAPDEWGHTIKAYATAHGELLGDAVPGNSPLNRNMHVPVSLVSRVSACFAFDPNVTAACQVPDPSSALIAAESNVSTYPPWYYAVVGGVPRLVGQDHRPIVYRATSLVVAAALVAWAATLLARSGRRRGLLALLALPPMALFMLMATNPTAVEIGGMMVLWAMAAWWLARASPPGRWQWFGASSVAALLVLVRPVSVAWVLVAAAAYLVLERRPRPAWRWATVAIAAAPLAVAVVLSAAWSRYADIGLADDKFVLPGGFVDHLRLSIGHTGGLFVESIGVLGWLDTSMPTVVYAVVVVGLVGVVLAALVHGDRRLRLVVGGLIAVWICYPIAYTTLARTPLNWQGRYNLPLYGGLVLIAAELVRRGVLARLAPRWPLLIGGGFVVVEVLAFHQTLRRFMVTSTGDLLLRNPSWRPWMNGWLLIVLNVAFAAGIVVTLARWPGPVAETLPVDEPALASVTD